VIFDTNAVSALLAGDAGLSAVLALQHGQPVVSQDGHFDDVPNLTRLSW